jgi:predicted transcriptional regulator
MTQQRNRPQRTITLDAEVDAAIEKIADAMCKPVSEIISDCLREKLGLVPKEFSQYKKLIGVK